ARGRAARAHRQATRSGRGVLLRRPVAGRDRATPGRYAAGREQAPLRRRSARKTRRRRPPTPASRARRARRQTMTAERFGGLRATIALEAARLMYEEGVKQYFTAKRIAAKRKLGRSGGKRLRYRPSDLPSNGEIRDALLGLAELAEGSRRTRRLFA